MNMIERLIYKPSGGQFRALDGINAIIEPSDLSLYQQLIPKPFTIPEKPVVFVFCAHHLTVRSWPLTPYCEWAIMLRCNWDGVPGWYILSIPVTKQVARLGGRYLGFPKYIADSISLAKDDHGLHAQSQYKGELELSLTFKPGLTRELSPLENELMADDSFFKKGDIYLFIPPGKGPRIIRLRLEHIITPSWVVERGRVQVQFAAQAPWSGLIAPGNTYPGTFTHFTGGMYIDW